MGRILDFTQKYAPKIFSINPSYTRKGGFSWSIVNAEAEAFGGVENVPVIHRSGIIKPFLNDSTLITMFDLVQKYVDIWRNDSGYSREPYMLVIEKPVNDSESSARYSNITDLSVFVGMLLCSLSPKETLAPAPDEWQCVKKNTEEEIFSIQDYQSKRALKDDLAKISLEDRPYVYDAIGLGIYGAKVNLGKKPLPKMYYKFKP